MLISRAVRLEACQLRAIDEKVENSGYSHIEKINYRRQLNREYLLSSDTICNILEELIDVTCQSKLSQQYLETVLNQCDAHVTRHFAYNSVTYVVDIRPRSDMPYYVHRLMQDLWHNAFYAFGDRAKVFQALDIEKASMWVDSLSEDQVQTFLHNNAELRTEIFGDIKLLVEGQERETAIISYLYKNCTQSYNPYLRIASLPQCPITNKARTMTLDLLPILDKQKTQQCFIDGILFGHYPVAIEGDCHKGFNGRLIESVDELLHYDHDEFLVDMID